MRCGIFRGSDNVVYIKSQTATKKLMDLILHGSLDKTHQKTKMKTPYIANAKAARFNALLALGSFRVN